MTIWKFPLAVTDHQVVMMPEGARILTVQMQQGTPFIWALVDEAARLENRTVRTVGTGHQIETEIGDYIGTYQLNHVLLVFHVFVHRSEHE